MLMVRLYFDSPDQPCDDAVPVTASLCQQISRLHGTYTPNQVLGELRAGHPVAVPGGFYQEPRH